MVTATAGPKYILGKILCWTTLYKIKTQISEYFPIYKFSKFNLLHNIQAL